MQISINTFDNRIISQEMSAGRNSKEHEVLLKAYADISKAIQSPLTLSGELLAAGLMAPALHDNMGDYITEKQKHHIMTTVLHKMEEDCKNFYLFVEILEKDRSMISIAQQLRSECGTGETIFTVHLT